MLDLLASRRFLTTLTENKDIPKCISILKGVLSMNEVINHFKSSNPAETLNKLWIQYIILSEKMKSSK